MTKAKSFLAKIDAVYNGYNIDYDNEEVVFTNFKTKAELGYDYRMSVYGTDNNNDGIVREWFEQARAFEQYVVGKTVNEVATMQTQLVNNYYISADNDLLSAGCTIQITEFIDAVVKACNDDQAKTFATGGDFTLGLGIISQDNGSYFDYDDYTAYIRMNVDFAASVTSATDGTTLALIVDGAQPQATIDEYGDVYNVSVGKGDGIVKTKRELKEDYGMSAAVHYGMDWNEDGVVKEWYLQSAAFSSYVVGLTANQIIAMPTQTVSNGHIISAEDELLNAGCTIQITGLKEVAVKSIANSR